MMHVAPCGCQLHVRIRELEAELALAKDQNHCEYDNCWLHGKNPVVARADRAEARAEMLKTELERVDAVHDSHIRMWKARAEKAEARVAELMENEYGWRLKYQSHLATCEAREREE